jgi:DnaJ like chaperone protein
LAQALKNIIRGDRNKQVQMMGFLIQLAFVDGEVSKAEEEILISIAETLAVDPKIYHSIFDQFESMMKNVQPQASIEDAYALLGVSPNDSLETVKKAYRKLVRAYHPDIIKAQGRDENYIKEATEKTQEINAAYEMIKKARAE